MWFSSSDAGSLWVQVVRSGLVLLRVLDQWCWGNLLMVSDMGDRILAVLGILSRSSSGAQKKVHLNPLVLTQDGVKGGGAQVITAPSWDLSGEGTNGAGSCSGSNLNFNCHIFFICASFLGSLFVLCSFSAAGCTGLVMSPSCCWLSIIEPQQPGCHLSLQSHSSPVWLDYSTATSCWVCVLLLLTVFFLFFFTSRLWSLCLDLDLPLSTLQLPPHTDRTLPHHCFN